MAEPLDNQSLAELLAQQTAALQAIATRPVKSSTTTYTSDTKVPRALQDMIKNRDSIRTVSRELDEALQPMEDRYVYRLGRGLSNITPTKGYGSWLSGALRALGGGLTSGTDLRAQRMQKKYENEMEDLAMILAYDKAMGDIGDQIQRQYVSYIQAPYALGSGKGQQQEQAETKVYDVTPPEMPEVKPYWTEIELQSEQRKDPETQARTGLGLTAKYVSRKINPEGRNAMQANQQAYTKTITQDAITKIAQKMGGSRGIDTIPEVNIKGGPELTASNMDSKQYESAVKDQFWDIADQIVKANPRTNVTRTELTNAIINSYNNDIRKEYRVVGQLPEEEKPGAVVPKTPQGKYDYSKYGF